MTLLADYLSDDVKRAVRKAADQVACEVVAQEHDGEAPAAYHRFVEDSAYEQMFEALDHTQVMDLADYGADEEETERVERSRGLV